MDQVKEHPAGTFCWVELATSNAASARKFYGSLFGWESLDSAMASGLSYTLFRWEGNELAGMYELNEAQISQGLQPHWLPYVSVANVEESARKVQSLNGSLLAGPLDAQGLGRAAIIADPAGAIFALWQAGRHRGASLIGVPPALCWNELLTPDPRAVEPFYIGLLGWEKEDMEFGEEKYTLFKKGEQSAAGMMQLTGEGVPPYWLTYFAVEDCDTVAEKAVDMGGGQLIAPQDIPAVGRFALLTDPQGAVFAILRLADANA